MINFKQYFLIFIININLINAAISDKRYCVDQQCTVPVARAKTLLPYSSPDAKILSFGQNVEIVIYSRPAGTKENLLGAEINGKRGYVPKQMVREYKVLNTPKLLVDTEFVDNTKKNDSGNVLPQVPLKNEKLVEPDKVQDSYEVVDGTTIYLNPQDTITPSSTENPVQPTATPATVKTTDSHEKLDKQPSGTIDKIETIIDDVLSTISNAISDNQETKESADEIDVEDEDEEDDGEDDNDDDDDDDDDEEEESQKDKTVITENMKEPITIENNNKNDEKSEIVEEKPSENQDKLKLTTFSAQLDETFKENLNSIKNNDILNNNEIQSSPGAVGKDDTVVETKLNNKVDDNKVTDDLKETTNLPELKIPPQSIETTTETVLNNKIETTVDNVKEEIVIEATTSLPELEIPPQSIESVIENITPNPVVPNIEEKQIKPEIISESPLGGLFGKKPELEVIQPVKTEEQINKDFTFNENIVNTPAEQMESNTDEKVESTGAKPDLEVPQPVKAEEQINKDLTANKEIVNMLNEQLQSNQSDEEMNSVETLQNSQIIDENQKEVIVEVPQIDKSSEEIVAEQAGMLSNVLSFFSGRSNDDDDNKQEESKDDAPPLPSSPAAVIDEKIETVTEPQVVENVVTTTKVVEDEKNEKTELVEEQKNVEVIVEDVGKLDGEFCSIHSCQQNMDNHQQESTTTLNDFELLDWSKLNTNIFIYLSTTALSVIILLIGYIAIEKNRREGPLVAKINKLEKDYLILLKENELLKDNSNDCDNDNNRKLPLSINDQINNDELIEKNQQIDELINIKLNLEEQIQSLEKELENSTEVGLELNRMLTEILNTQNGSDIIKANIDNLQKQLIEQQITITTVNETLSITNTENHELKLEIELNNKKILDLQSELDKMCLNILKIEEEKDTQQNLLENEITKYRQLYEDLNNKTKIAEIESNRKIELLENQLKQTQHDYELKQKEFNIFKDNVKLINNNDDNGTTLTTLIETTEITAELELLKIENQRLNDKLTQLQNDKNRYEKQTQTTLEELQRLQVRYDENDKLRVETQTKLEVLSNYFKEKEAQLQKELSKHESLWAEKQGEATSTTERIKFMQEQLQNYKAQNESLKQEIISQEVELKSQISVLEKKVHENWVNSRQIERKLEDAKQEAAQLRHRLTLSERALQEEKTQHRLQSPIENGDLSVSTLHVESPSSPPLLYGRDHMTKSPPLPPGLPPFLPPPPPPPGVPFMPPPTSSGLHGIPPPPFIPPPPPPTLYPGDHRPPPLGRMSSPPLNSRYSPSSRGYSPYDRNHSSSPSDSEYGTSPPQQQQRHHHHHQHHHRRGYSPFNDDRRDYKRPQPIRSNGRHIKGGSSGSGHSNESLDKINRQQSKV